MTSTVSLAILCVTIEMKAEINRVHKAKMAYEATQLKKASDNESSQESSQDSSGGRDFRLTHREFASGSSQDVEEQATEPEMTSSEDQSIIHVGRAGVGKRRVVKTPPEYKHQSRSTTRPDWPATHTTSGRPLNRPQPDSIFSTPASTTTSTGGSSHKTVRFDEHPHHGVKEPRIEVLAHFAKTQKAKEKEQQARQAKDKSVKTKDKLPSDDEEDQSTEEDGSDNKSMSGDDDEEDE